MKTLVIFLLLGFSAVMTNAQGVIKLNEAKVEYNPLFTQLDHSGNTFSATVKESYRGQFEKNPMKFVKENFDASQLMVQLEKNKFDSFYVSFKNRKGELKVNYNRDGEILNSSQRFKNVALPQAVAQQLFRENTGWSMVKNVHVAHGKAGNFDTDYYKVTMENGKDRKKVKINNITQREGAVAGAF